MRHISLGIARLGWIVKWFASFPCLEIERLDGRSMPNVQSGGLHH